MEKQKLIVVAGPTASGKTSLSISIAQRFNGEIISADSMQLYRELQIATAKPTEQEMQGIQHHLINIRSVTEPFSAAEFVQLAAECIRDIASRGRLPIIVGGTGLYIDSLLQNNSFERLERDDELRRRLESEVQQHGIDALYERLQSVDPTAAEKIHKNNTKRVIRALEVYELTGRRFSELGEQARANECPYEPLYLCITFEQRERLYERIDRRVDEMLQQGLIDEVRRFYEYENASTSAQAIGCKELKPYLDGVASLSQCTERLKQSTRHYAKRQLTWFRRNESAIRLVADSEDIKARATALCDEFLRKEGGQ